MKKIIIVFFLGIFCLLQGQNFTELAIGSAVPLPDRPLKDVSGKNVTLKEVLQGKKGMLVIFSCNTCPYVKLYEERIRKIIDFCNEKQIGVIVVNSNEAKRNDEDSYDAMKKYHAEHLQGAYYAVDEKSALADAFGATRTPQCFLFGSDGKLIYRGAIDDNVKSPSDVKIPYLMKALEAMLSNKLPEIQSTKSIGCTIKRLE